MKSSLAGAALACLALMLSATPAAAQRLTFEQSYDAPAGTALDVSTLRGKIDIATGEPGRVKVVGTVTIRLTGNVPANAPELASRVAAHPPIEQTGNFIRLRPPTDTAERRAVTVSYEVRVPPQTRVTVLSDSGAITIRGIDAPVSVSTQSGAIELSALLGSAEVTTGSGAVQVDHVAGQLAITTKSSGIDVRRLGGGLDAMTGSGEVQASMTGGGNVRVRTQSSAIRLDGVSGSLDVSTQSGRVTVSGAPRAPWDVSTGSGAVDVGVTERTSITLDATSRSGSVKSELSVDGPSSKGRVAGAIAGGGPLVRLASRSGSIKIAAAR